MYLFFAAVPFIENFLYKHTNCVTKRLPIASHTPPSFPLPPSPSYSVPHLPSLLCVTEEIEFLKYYYTNYYFHISSHPSSISTATSTTTATNITTTTNTTTTSNTATNTISTNTNTLSDRLSYSFLALCIIKHLRKSAIWPLPCKDVPGIGKASFEGLSEGFGVSLVRDLYTRRYLLSAAYGGYKYFNFLLRSALGVMGSSGTVCYLWSNLTPQASAFSAFGYPTEAIGLKKQENRAGKEDGAEFNDDHFAASSSIHSSSAVDANENDDNNGNKGSFLSRKSLGLSRTFKARSPEEFTSMTQYLVNKLSRSVINEGISFKTVTLGLKGTDFQFHQYTRSLPLYITVDYPSVTDKELRRSFLYQQDESEEESKELYENDGVKAKGEDEGKEDQKRTDDRDGDVEALINKNEENLEKREKYIGKDTNGCDCQEKKIEDDKVRSRSGNKNGSSTATVMTACDDDFMFEYNKFNNNSVDVDKKNLVSKENADSNSLSSGVLMLEALSNAIKLSSSSEERELLTSDISLDGKLIQNSIKNNVESSNKIEENCIINNSSDVDNSISDRNEDNNGNNRKRLKEIPDPLWDTVKSLLEPFLQKYMEYRLVNVKLSNLIPVHMMAKANGASSCVLPSKSFLSPFKLSSPSALISPLKKNLKLSSATMDDDNNNNNISLNNYNRYSGKKNNRYYGVNLMDLFSNSYNKKISNNNNNKNNITTDNRDNNIKVEKDSKEIKHTEINDEIISKKRRTENGESDKNPSMFTGKKQNLIHFIDEESRNSNSNNENINKNSKEITNERYYNSEVDDIKNDMNNEVSSNKKEIQIKKGANTIKIKENLKNRLNTV